MAFSSGHHRAECVHNFEKGLIILISVHVVSNCVPVIQVAETFQILVERTPGLVVHLVEARRRLEGQPTSDLLSMPHNNLMEGAIVLEEFIKVMIN